MEQTEQTPQKNGIVAQYYSELRPGKLWLALMWDERTMLASKKTHYANDIVGWQIGHDGGVRRQKIGSFFIPPKDYEEASKLQQISFDFQFIDRIAKIVENEYSKFNIDDI